MELMSVNHSTRSGGIKGIPRGGYSNEYLQYSYDMKVVTMNKA